MSNLQEAADKYATALDKATRCHDEQEQAGAASRAAFEAWRQAEDEMDAARVELLRAAAGIPALN